ncbi:response regulator [Pandoraea apista]|uniref:Response regulator n=1 Tax=Pandoraea apista TaxID=93218 RepID=A0ABX9ZLD6_9BURK|nr:response regulator [Pandoraea apista]AVF42045.1 two-component system response regulator OmpR [Pandoraea apista]OXS88939.1 two-component system response regulator OmpR [Pandoraea apista]PTE01823.1 two-component system response regulator OmpR [Pandoraea apista]RRJ28384.1 response regulator [Pandoraea apista]RRJ73571.1 response regulator [Pandoraea apista]
MSLHVLLVDDDPVVRDLLRELLHANGMQVSVLHNGASLLRRLELERPSVILLDIMMPERDGLRALQDLRAAGEDIPVIMLSARGGPLDRALGLELGADDYLAKPFDPRELLARIHAVLRRRGPVAASAPDARAPYRFGPFELDFSLRTLQREGERLPLRDTEFAMLKAFTQHPMQVLPRVKLHAMLYGDGIAFRDRSLDVPVWRLRRLIETDPSEPRYIQTIRGKGYVFVPGGELSEGATSDARERSGGEDIGDGENHSDSGSALSLAPSASVNKRTVRGWRESVA